MNRFLWGNKIHADDNVYARHDFRRLAGLTPTDLFIYLFLCNFKIGHFRQTFECQNEIFSVVAGVDPRSRDPHC